MTVDQLLAGPRGRRLALEFALWTEQRDALDGPCPVAIAVSHAAHRLDGAGRARAYTARGWMIGRRRGRALQVPEVTPDEVATQLDSLVQRTAGVDSPDIAAQLTVLDHAVANARYWQEPDGEDRLAAVPAVLVSLEHWAARLLPHAAWWSSGCDHATQHLVRWPPPDASSDGPGDPVARLATWRAEIDADESRARAEVPSDIHAPYSGQWWSMPPHGLCVTTRMLGALGPAGLWLVEDSFGHERAATVAVEVPEDLRVLEIRGSEDWAEICRRWPVEVTAHKRHDWYRATGRNGRWVVPDWTLLAREYDGVHLSVAGYLSTAGTAIDVDGEAASVIAGWDPDSTWWFTPRVRASGPALPWRLDDGHWHPST
ncbi:hypothetical protein EDD31_2833 [Bogoriella caseilytica]|uniref:Uncharacterized protein n=2 Tax=Bogoriella caseilytica TaxID=56055 RepID=A0A3N2BGR7_9MICO|nr:hypothetical protein EDD31_2833 [Bogoriella caseilytica]